MKKVVALALLLGLGLGYLAGHARLHEGAHSLLSTAAAQEPAAEVREIVVIQAPPTQIPAPLPSTPDTPAQALDLGPFGETSSLVNLFRMPDAELGPPTPAPNPAEMGIEAFLRDNRRPWHVRPGQSLSRIAKSCKVSYELLMRLNGMTSHNLGAGQRIWVVKGPFHVLVDCSARRLMLTHGKTWIASYPVAVGPGTTTPHGRFEVLSKIKKPDWTNPQNREIVAFGHPDNPLGTRWIAFTPGYGIHGTNEPASIGTASSKGCIRMFNEDVEELYDFLRYSISTVEIVE
jgi:hypothetical protein